jgi:SSS family solute:Na+ symporter
MATDIIVIAVYIIMINIIGLAFSRTRSLNDYFLGNRSIPWPIVCFSIVATETSSLTFISIPGLAYITDMGFLQIAAGYIAGRFLVAGVLLPRYFEGRLETTYEFLQNRFGLFPRRVVSVLFHITRIFADGIRLFATALPLSFLLGFQGYWQSILLIAAATFVYTLYGGIRSVVLTDAVQLGIYLLSAAAGLWIISDILNLPMAPIWRGLPLLKKTMFSSGLDGGWRGFFGSYNIFSGLIGGALLSFASHGTDHLIVQRVLSCRGLKSAQKAMVFSGFLVFFQFALFLALGLFIFTLLGGKRFGMPDAIMPYFIIHYVPAGFKGLMLAGILAAAMSSMSSSINSLSSSTVMDLLMISRAGTSERRKLGTSRLVSLMWTFVIAGIALLLKNTKSPLVELALNIASITYGCMLGIFLQAALFKDFSDKASIGGAMISVAAMLIIYFDGTLLWPWFVPIGFTISFVSGILINMAVSKRPKSPPPANLR